jgi:hypothetical protein
MTDEVTKNKDGFEPGQDLSFADLMAMRAQKPNAAAPKQLPTREEIAKMPKADLIEWLAAHGADNPEGKVSELREQLTAIMYADL